MEAISFDQLPQAVGQLAAKLDRIEQLLQKQSPPPKEAKDDIVNIDAACKILDLAKPTVYGLVSQRKLPFMKKGKKLYFSRQELTEWLQHGHRAVKDDLETIVDNALFSTKSKRRGR